MAFLSLLRPDRFTIALVATAVLATVLPATGAAAPILKMVIVGSIALLFFLQGARLHLMVFAATFILFPILGLLTKTYLQSYLAPGIALGILYLCLLPSTIQSSITFTSIAGGNVAAAVCSASASNVLGVFLTPLLMGFFMQTQGGVSLDGIGKVVMQILISFLIGHLVRPWIRK